MIREILTMPQEIAWLPWAVQYFFFIGIAATGALLAVLLRWFKNGQASYLELITLALSTTVGIVGPIALSADLHQPGRIINFYLSITPWSWMWIGAIIVPFFVVFLLLQFILVLRENTTKEGTFKWFRAIHWFNFNPTNILPFSGFFLAVFAIGILLYTGKEVNVLKSQPIWHTVFLPWILFFSALQVMPMLIKTWLNWTGKKENSLFLNITQIIGIVGTMLSILLLAISNNEAGLAFRELPEKGSVWITIGLSVTFFLVILLLFTIYTYKGKRELKWFVYAFLSLCSLSLAWTIRWVILMQTQTLPKYNILINPYHLDWGFNGALGIISTFGLWLTLLIIFWSLLNDRWFVFKGVHRD